MGTSSRVWAFILKPAYQQVAYTSLQALLLGLML